MRTTPLPVLLAAGLLLVACSGPGWRATEMWHAACDAEAGTRIAETVRDVDGFVYEGETRRHFPYSGSSEIEVYPTVPVLDLFNAGKKRYAYIEITVPPGGAYNQFYHGLDLPEGHYRLTHEGAGHPGCLPDRFRRDEDRYCIAATPVARLTARYRVAHSRATWADNNGGVLSETFEVTDAKTGAEIARHAHHALYWTRPIIPMVGEAKQRSCPTDDPAFDIRTILQPRDDR